MHFCISDHLYDPPFRIDTANVQSIHVLFLSSFFKGGAVVMFLKHGAEAKVHETRKLLVGINVHSTSRASVRS